MGYKVSYEVLVIAPSAEEGETLQATAEGIRRALEPAKMEARVTTAMARSGQELFDALARRAPAILHRLGEGGSRGLPAADLARCLEELEGGPACLVLTEGFSLQVADELLAWIPVVIGFEHDPGPEVKERFSRAFYRALAEGATFQEAFERGFESLRSLGLAPRFSPRLASSDSGSAGVPGLDFFWTGRRIRLEEELARGPVRSDRGGIRGDDSVGAPLEDSPKCGYSTDGTLGGEPRDPATDYPLWFGTNRAPRDPDDPSLGFGNERSRELLLGTCRVTVPRSHRIGSLGSSWWKRLLRRSDDRLRLDAASLRLLAREAFWLALREELAGRDPKERDSVVFLHGYNVSFEEAALRAAQIGFDLAVGGAMAFFSWPSKGTLAGYPADEDSIDASEAAITEFLSTFTRASGAERVHVIAHSMGNRGLLRAMNRILGEVEEATPVPFGQILLAAPDVSQDLFRDLAAAYARLAQRTTLYVSAKDRALASSSLFHDADRAGYTPPVTVVPGIDTVEVTQIDLSLLGHGFVGAARPVLTDMHTLLRTGAAPEARFGLQAATTAEGAGYWVIGG